MWGSKTGEAWQEAKWFEANEWLSGGCLYLKVLDTISNFLSWFLCMMMTFFFLLKSSNFIFSLLWNKIIHIFIYGRRKQCFDSQHTATFIYSCIHTVPTKRVTSCRNDQGQTEPGVNDLTNRCCLTSQRFWRSVLKCASASPNTTCQEKNSNSTFNWSEWQTTSVSVLIQH